MIQLTLFSPYEFRRGWPDLTGQSHPPSEAELYQKEEKGGQPDLKRGELASVRTDSGGLSQDDSGENRSED